MNGEILKFKIDQINDVTVVVVVVHVNSNHVVGGD